MPQEKSASIQACPHLLCHGRNRVQSDDRQWKALVLWYFFIVDVLHVHLLHSVKYMRHCTGEHMVKRGAAGGLVGRVFVTSSGLGCPTQCERLRGCGSIWFHMYAPC